MSASGGWTPGGTEEDPGAEFGFEPEAEDDARDAGPDRGRLKKSPSAFRTISEVADDLHIPQHVLRFWETRFPQVKPLKRGGGRRYYRPDDIALLRRISDLLYIQGYTIKGVQRLLREGDGTLSGVLPPPDVADRGDDPEIMEPRPDMPVEIPVEILVPASAPVPAAEPWMPAPPPLPTAEVEALEGEVRRLRHLLEMVLDELQDMRQGLAV